MTYAEDRRRLKLQIGSREVPVNADGFLDFLRNAIDALKALDKGLSTYGVETIRWEIADAGTNSPLFATISGAPLFGDNGSRSEDVIDTFVTGVEHLTHSNTCPHRFNKDALRYVKQLVVAAGLYRLHPVVSTGSHRVSLKKTVASNADWAIKVLDFQKTEYVEHGSLEGVLTDLGMVRTRDKMVIVDQITGEKTPCYLRNVNLEEQLRQAWKKRVVITGDILFNKPMRKPVRITVDEIRILRDRHELPQMEDLHGIDITGGVESSAHIRGIRDVD